MFYRQSSQKYLKPIIYLKVGNIKICFSVHKLVLWYLFAHLIVSSCIHILFSKLYSIYLIYVFSFQYFFSQTIDQLKIFPASLKQTLLYLFSLACIQSICMYVFFLLFICQIKFYFSVKVYFVYIYSLLWFVLFAILPVVLS